MKSKLLFALKILLHMFIISGFLYAGWQVFHVASCTSHGVLFGSIKFENFECIATRRLYAIEFWIIFFGYVIYLKK
jgi:hypothetical protein